MIKFFENLWKRRIKQPEPVELLPQETIDRLESFSEVKCFYVTTTLGAGLREGINAEEVREAVQEEIGTLESVKEIRLATADDANWIAFMGGHLPRTALDL